MVRNALDHDRSHTISAESAKRSPVVPSLYRLIEPAGSSQNIESAIAAYKEVLGFPTGNKTQRQRWAKAAEKLVDCYKQRKEGSGVENSVLAAKAYEQALTIFTREAYPEDCARVQALKDEVQAEAKAGQAGELH
jgi:hypothetical protein